MKTIIYKKRLGEYECTKITDSGGDRFKMVFDEPLDGKLTVGEEIFTLAGGVATGLVSSLGEGEIRPKLYCGAQSVPIESFIVNGGNIHPARVDDGYVRRLAEFCSALSNRVGELEKQMEAANEKIDQPLKF
ncbi:MAG: hypothetical protein J6V09_03295 [Clostridia bacterium]|nr:hypothetical protein [Clostridia bacterium]